MASSNTNLSTACRSLIIVATAGWCLSVSAVGSAQPTLVFIANHDVKLTVAGESRHVTSQAKVRDGRSFPVHLGEYRLDIGVSNIGNGAYMASVDVYQKTDDGWYKVNVDTLSFEAIYAAPTQFIWSAGDLSLDLGIAVSVFPQ